MSDSPRTPEAIADEDAALEARIIAGTTRRKDIARLVETIEALQRENAALAALVALAERQREVLARFRDAWFEWDGEYEPLDAAASEAMTALDDEVLVLTDKGRAAARGYGR